MKTCKTCGCEKPYDPAAKKNSKASGFFGAKCWDCFVEADRLRCQQPVTLASGEVVSYTAAAARKNRSTEEGRAKHSAASAKYFAQSPWHKLKKQLAIETNRVLKQLAKGRGTDYMCLKIFGEDRETVYAHIDAQLQAKGFKWENHGKEWQLDHRKPLAMAQSSIELYQLCLLENVQLLTKAENAIKAIADRELIRQHEA